MASHLAGDLEQLRALPLEAKVNLTKSRIRQWLDHYDGMAYVSFSGGKDSTVLAHLVHQVDPTVPLVFSNTGLEYASIRSFARKMGAEIIHPEMRFDEVITKYGYPIISKEVSEAIYYARRIRNGSERERERELPSGKERNCKERETARRRNDLEGKWQNEPRTGGAVQSQECSARTPLNGRTAEPTEKERIPFRQALWKRIELQGLRKPCGTREETYKAIFLWH